MALKIEFLGVTSYVELKSEKKKTAPVVLTTDKTTVTLCLECVNTEDPTQKTQNYLLSVVNMNFRKKMYQPTAIMASIQILPIQTKNGKEEWHSIRKDYIVNLFLNKQVKLYDADNTDYVVGSDFYVKEVTPCYRNDSMNVTLKIFSLDKLLTLEHNCRTFVSKKLGADILKEVFGVHQELVKKKVKKTVDGVEEEVEEATTVDVPNYPKPYKPTEKLAYNKEYMRVLSYLTGNKDKNGKDIYNEHIFPFLVQYNESIYDMLARTANRWGEFLYYEDGQLNIGYKYDKDKVKVLADYNTLTYIDLDEMQQGDHYERAADYDKNFSDSPLKKSPNKVSGIMYRPGGNMDKVVMKKFAAFFKNDKSLPTFIMNQVFDDSIDLASKTISTNHKNSEFDDEWFSDNMKKASPEKYGNYNHGDDEKKDICYSYNPFSEINSSYTSKKYAKILKLEREAVKDAILIDFDTTYPNLKLGEVFSVDGQEYIVIQVDCVPKNMQKVSDDLWVLDSGDSSVLTYQVKALPRSISSTDKGQLVREGDFYPTVIPSGHARFADPQMAKVADASDPDGKGRVRVRFTWQADEDEASPWIQFAANAGGQKGIMGAHYKDDKVFIGFVDGNVERPYVLGAVSKGTSSDVQCVTPGGHGLKLEDNKGGITSFLTRMFLPGWGTLSTFIPQMSGINPFSNAEKNLALAGGFELSDNYGIYKISGSTEGREVSIASPWGDVSINAFTGITISAPNGDIEIKGKNVKIAAGNNLELVSGTNVKYKLMGGDAIGCFTDIALAVSKKLAEMGLSLVTIDLKMVRAMFEIAFRPTEGKLLLKSNRYLMLEAGKGTCYYPQGAYKDETTYNKAMAKNVTAEIREGLKLTSTVEEMVEKMSTVADGIDAYYRNAYNKCVDLKNAYLKAIDDNWKYADNFSTKNPAYVHGFDELKTEFWKEGPYVPWTEDKLGFTDNFKLNTGGCTNEMLQHYRALTHMLPQPNDQQKIKDDIKAARETARADILKAANDLRKAICELLDVKNLFEEKQLKKQFSFFKDHHVPDTYKKALYGAFDRSKLTDIFYLKEVGPDEKKLSVKYATDDALKAHRVVLKRKASILMLEAMGFKDEWRKQKANPNYVAPNPLALGQVQVIPAEKPTVLELERKTGAADLTDEYWTKYVESLESVPPLSPAKTKYAEKMLETFKEWKEGWNPFAVIPENRSWGDFKKGGILFSTNENIYDLSNNILEVPSPARENLKITDDHDHDRTITDFLTALKRKLNDLK